MKVGRFNLRISYPPKPQALLLESNKSPHMWNVCAGVRVEGYELRDRVLILRPRFVFGLLKYSRKTTHMAAMLCARIWSQKIPVLLSLDNHDKFNKVDPNHPRRYRRVNRDRTLFDEVSSQIPKLKILSVQHGQELRRLPVGRPKKNVTLLCWGEWSARNFPRFGRNESHFVTVGALTDGLYRSVRPQNIAKNVRICLVSTVKGKDWWGDTKWERRDGYETLVNHLAQFAESNGHTVHVALTVDRDQYGPTDAESERRWFLERLGPTIQFTEPSLMSGDAAVSFAGRHEPQHLKERYASYYLSDRSEITIGMSSSVLWESFGRGNKMLAVNQTDNEVYDFPIDGFWSLRRPSYLEFAERMNLILNMPQDVWFVKTQVAQRELVDYREESPPAVVINQMLREAVGAEKS